MKFSTIHFVSALLTSTSCTAFAPLSQQQQQRQNYGTTTTSLEASTIIEEWKDRATKVLATGLITASLWGAPNMIAQQTNNIPTFMPDSLNTIANAKELASGSGSRVNKDPESLLRYGLPINSKEVCVKLVKRKRWKG